MHVGQFGFQPLEAPIKTIVDHDGHDDAAEKNHRQDSGQSPLIGVVVGVGIDAIDAVRDHGRRTEISVVVVETVDVDERRVNRRRLIAVFPGEARSANAAAFRVTNVIVVFALARLVTVFAPVTLRTNLLAAKSSVTGRTLAPTIHWITGSVVVAVTLMTTARPKSAPRTGLTAVLAPPTAWTATFTSDVEALGIVLA